MIRCRDKKDNPIIFNVKQCGGSFQWIRDVHEMSAFDLRLQLRLKWNSSCYIDYFLFAEIDLSHQEIIFLNAIRHK